MSRKPKKRCAIYTRKSTEEGLDQEFNSLDAQREACEAYTLSQAGEGWKALPDMFDDGGYSGGTMERPALGKLLDLVKTGSVDVIVVYKIDRLTRSLADFAKMVEIFDEYSVSFVSVTQAFNTTTSMGRLTLNVLLSFAQFEREVTAERIRDKIKSSKEKGMWMGGRVPLGYDAKDRKLVINREEADKVRHIFKRYLALRSVLRLKEELETQGFGSKKFVSKKGTISESRPFTKGALYHLLQNPNYIGIISHKGLEHPGLHEAIIDDGLWKEVQELLANNRITQRSRTNARHPSLLAGLVFDASGNPLTPSQANKGGVRYRYYRLKPDSAASENASKHLPAVPIENLVRKTLTNILSDPASLLDLHQNLGLGAEHLEKVLQNGKRASHEFDTRQSNQIRFLKSILDRVVIGKNTLSLNANAQALVSLLCPQGEIDTESGTIELAEVPFSLKHTGKGSRLILPSGGDAPSREPDPNLVKTLARAHLWVNQLTTGQASSIKEIATAEDIDQRYVARVIRLAFLAPDIVKEIFAGREPSDLTADKLIRTPTLPTDWQEQSRALGF